MRLSHLSAKHNRENPRRQLAGVDDQSQDYDSLIDAWPKCNKERLQSDWARLRPASAHQNHWWRQRHRFEMSLISYLCNLRHQAVLISKAEAPLTVPIYYPLGPSSPQFKSPQNLPATHFNSIGPVFHPSEKRCDELTSLAELNI